MKLKTLLFVAGAGLMSLAFSAYAIQAGQVYQLTPIYKVGQKVKYKTAMDMDGQMQMAINFSMAMETTKVDADGGADMTFTISDMSVAMNGQTMPTPGDTQKPMTVHVDKFGMASGEGAKMNMAGNIGAMVTAGLSKGISVGQTVNLDSTDAKTGDRVWGTVKCDSVKDGILELSEDLQIKMKANTGDPMHVIGNESIDVETHTMVHLKTTATNVQGPGGMSFNKVSTTMDLLK